MEEIKELIFDFAYHEALDDATRRVYKNKNEVEKCSKAKQIVRNYIDDILSGKEPCFYQIVEKFERCINNELNEENRNADNYFNFGKSQKLINMTAKYFYVSCYYDIDLRKKFEKCHCPMDSNLIKKVFDENCVEKNCLLKKSTAWSHLSSDSEYKAPQEYEDFQKAIQKYCKENCNPIEADFKLWNK